ncbi:MAG TPA: helix-turn-helix transcriptional regulator [Pseudonocardiaceae bacterium]|nr:helix-turn-helix transcriptional regulator [Pseudonocardiaceae bacterium]
MHEHLATEGAGMCDVGDVRLDDGSERCEQSSTMPPRIDGGSDPPPGVPNRPLNVTRAMRYLQEHFADPELSLDKVAKAAGLSRWHFCRTMRRYTGRRFVDHVNTLRVERAAILLTATSATVTDVGRQVGYRDMRHFRRMFKQWSGLSPSDYRDRRQL